MTRIGKWMLPVVAFFFLATLGNADVKCTEAVNGKANGDASNTKDNPDVVQASNTGGGCISFVGGSNIVVASDNEMFFNPFGYTVKGKSTAVTDAIDLFAFFGDYEFDDPSGEWVAIPSPTSGSDDIWVLPEGLKGPEPMPTVEFNEAASMGLRSVTLKMFEPDGKTVSDVATIDCSDPKACTLEFQSDVPEPNSLILMSTALLGAFGIGRMRLRRQSWSDSPRPNRAS